MGLLTSKKTRRPVHKVNGHPVIEKMPGLYMHKTANEFAVRIELQDASSPTGKSDIYVHKNCLLYRGGHYAQAMYDVQLIDEDYTLYRTYVDKATGFRSVEVVPDRASVDEVVNMMQDTQDEYWKKESKIRRLDRSIAAMPRDMITESYLSRQSDSDAMEM